MRITAAPSCRGRAGGRSLARRGAGRIVLTPLEARADSRRGPEERVPNPPHPGFPPSRRPSRFVPLLASYGDGQSRSAETPPRIFRLGTRFRVRCHLTSEIPTEIPPHTRDPVQDSASHPRSRPRFRLASEIPPDIPPRTRDPARDSASHPRSRPRFSLASEIPPEIPPRDLKRTTSRWNLGDLWIPRAIPPRIRVPSHSAKALARDLATPPPRPVAFAARHRTRVRARPSSSMRWALACMWPTRGRTET